MRIVALRRTLGAVLGAAVAAGTLFVAPSAASAAPETPSFPSSIDGYAPTDSQDTCSPTQKPGVVDFRSLLNRTYGSHTGYITRACDSGGTSEHKEGRALDYMLNYNNANDRADATDVLNWLLATDSHGNKHAMARRLGIMYIIWNHRIWSAARHDEGWRSYSGDNPHTDHIHFSFSWAGARRQTSWWTQAGANPDGQANIYGFLEDGRMTYTAVDAATGDRTHGAIVSSRTLGFKPVAMATLNFNTVLVTNEAGHLFRVDVITNRNNLIYDPPVKIGEGWTHRLLAFDGYNHLFGIAGDDGQLRRYDITTAKPSSIGGNTFIKAGFTLKTLTATGKEWIMGTTSGGALISYRINGPGDTPRFELRSSTWQVFDTLMSPGGGVYFGHKPDGSMYRYIDDEPYDGKSDDLTGEGTVDEGGWTQVLLSAQPRTVS
ncbi:hypothetical protein Val02_88320 [Virgisporangium aliadipatigenens]|uniref:ARB-07466-like C-terminal domain-containing protein n=1 Tax=Virgisporangium aliadipatigenens TaxID=741659 RepID=A0A8J3YUU2_9ACTN|nr:tachylectin-related carbohydrate-binding protein [Virgisporangium aliadipatigenens]GIJ51946.1 hypothetical protein Val02_88320 [Virgisporangium aliadipatigenens]